MEVAPHINVDPAIHHGKAVITGTRMPVSLVIGSLTSGMTLEEVMHEYELTAEQIQAALAYAATTEDDPLLKLLGSIHLEGISDLGENHDYYIGQALYRELHPDQ